uniref:CRAL-TRIO domain-containing protein n=3 Tax=Rhodnius TaxID=13248 RepID=T1HUL4_RHOPR
MDSIKDVTIDDLQMKCLCELKKLVEAENGLHIGEDNRILLRYLYFSNFDVPKAFTKMKSVYRLKYDSRNWFATEVMTERQKLALSRNVHCLLKDKDQLGRSVYLLRLGNVVIGEVEPWENFQVDDLWLELALDDPDTWTNGLVYIFDMQGLSWKYLRYFTPQNCKIGSSKAEGIPVRKVEYHIINSGLILNSLVTIIFPFLSSSTKQNVHFHKNNWPSLHKYVTPDILPQEYGGKLTTLDYADLRCYLTDNEKRLN